MNNLIGFMSVVASDDLGKNWVLFEVIAIILGCLPWIALVLYIAIFRKFSIVYYVNNVEVYRDKYKNREQITMYKYETSNCIIEKWYLDQELTKEFNYEMMPKHNIKVFAEIKKEDNSDAK